MKGIRDFLNYPATSFPFGVGRNLDPNRDRHKAIDVDFDMLSGEKIDCWALLGSGELLGFRIEEESDRALQRERMKPSGPPALIAMAREVYCNQGSSGLEVEKETD